MCVCVLQVGAVDGDTGDNAWVSYSLLPSSEFAEQFNIDDETGTLHDFFFANIYMYVRYLLCS